MCLYLTNICLLVHIHGYNDIWLYGCLNLQDDPTSSPLKTRPHLDLYFLSYCKTYFFRISPLLAYTVKLEKYDKVNFHGEILISLVLILYVAWPLHK